MNKATRFLYYSILFITPLLLAVSYKNVANIVSLVFLLILFFSWKEMGTIKNNGILLISFLLFLGYALLSSAWAYQPGLAFERAIKISLLLGPGVLLLASRHPAKHVQHETAFKLVGSALIISAVLTTWQLSESVLIKEIITGSEGRANKAADLTPMIACMSVLIWPMLLLVKKGAWEKQIKQACIAILITGLLLLLTLGDSGAAILATITGGLSFFWVKAGGKTTAFKGLIIISVILFIFLPPNLYNKPTFNEAFVRGESVIVENVFQPSILHRIEIWDRCIELAKERPFFGWGISASRALPKTDQPSKYRTEHKRTDFMYPHNIFLQCWLELGLLGLIILLFWLNALLNWTGNLPIQQRPFYAAAIMSVLTIYAFGNPVWRSWWIVFLLVVAMMIQIAVKQGADSNSFTNTKP